MYKINYDRIVTALWDPELKEELFDIFFEHFPSTAGLPQAPRVIAAKVLGSSFIMANEMLEAFARYLLEMEVPDPHELKAFIKRNTRIMQIQINKILDTEEMEELAKKRGYV